jgi:nicotinate-nucleotide adenylyltransferase
MGLEHVLFVPTGSPPHRAPSLASAEDRLAMLSLAIADNPAFRVSRIEMDRAGPSYTVDTLRELAVEARRNARKPDLVLILSAETLLDLPGWHEPQGILELARLAVTPRVGHAMPSAAWLAKHFAGFEDRVTFLDGPRLEVSSTAIRKRRAAGRSIRYLVPAPVVSYIGDHGLYASSGRPAGDLPATDRTLSTGGIARP